jgi:hypothetical protein
MLFMETVAVYCENHAAYLNIQHRQMQISLMSKHMTHHYDALTSPCSCYGCPVNLQDGPSEEYSAEESKVTSDIGDYCRTQ